MRSWRSGVMKYLPYSKHPVKYALNDIFRDVCGICILLSTPLPLVQWKTGGMLNHTVGWRVSLQVVLHTELLSDR